MEVGVFTAGGYKFLCRSRNAENMNSNGHSLTDDAPQQKCKTNAKYVFSSLPLWLLSSEWAGVWDQWHHYWWIPHIVSSPDSNISCLVSHSHISAAAGAWSGEFLTLCHSLSASCLIRALSFGWPENLQFCIVTAGESFEVGAAEYFYAEAPAATVAAVIDWERIDQYGNTSTQI